jgi:type VI protein secretion system component VasK
MSTSSSKFISGFLSNASQRAHAENEDEKPATEVKPKAPVTPQLALLRRIKKVVFSPATKTLEQALEKFETIVDSLDDSEDDDAPKPSDIAKE